MSVSVKRFQITPSFWSIFPGPQVGVQVHNSTRRVNGIKANYGPNLLSDHTSNVSSEDIVELHNEEIGFYNDNYLEL